MAKTSASGKKLRRCKPHLTPPEKVKVKKGALHKMNGPRSRWNTPKPLAAWLDRNFKQKGRSEYWAYKLETERRG